MKIFSLLFNKFMIKKPHILGLTLQSVKNEEEPEGCRLEREITDNSL